MRKGERLRKFDFFGRTLLSIMDKDKTALQREERKKQQEAEKAAKIAKAAAKKDQAEKWRQNQVCVTFLKLIAKMCRGQTQRRSD